MDENLNWKYLLNDARARIYLLWAVLSIVGFTAAHFSRKDLGINGFWVILSALGLGYMYKVMLLRMKPARRVMQSWLIPISAGLVVSILAFYIPFLSGLISYLGVFWLFIMALSFFLNGVYDPPSAWYWVAVVLNVAAALLILFSDELLAVQWLLAATVSGWSMLNLWLFRS